MLAQQSIQTRSSDYSLITNYSHVKIIISLGLLSLFLGCKSTAQKTENVTIDIKQMTQDISYLSSDELGGRASFSNGIDLAADYIEKRFLSIGLKPLSGHTSFRQSFPIYQIKPRDYNVSINDKAIENEHVLILTSYDKINWDNPNQFEIAYIRESDDFRKKMSEINQSRTTDTLILVAESHNKLFTNYRDYFNKGISRFEKNQGPSALFVLTNHTSVKRFSASIETKLEEKRLTNVVGVLPGKSLANENVLFSAHYDHLGTNLSLDGDNIFNGADDDASGTTAVINLAEYFAQRGNNQRSLIFVAFTAEEIGGYGSKYFSQQLAPKTITAMINIEMIGKESKYGFGALWMTGYDRSNLAELMNSNSTSTKIHADPYPQQRLFYRSDNATLARMGVPAHSFSSSQIDIDQHYHKVSDSVATLNLPSMHQVITTLAIASESLVDGSSTPTRVNTEQVRPSGAFY